MKRLSNLLAGLIALLRRRETEAELDEEIDAYLEASAGHKQLTGMSREAALREARIEIGSRNAVKHRVWNSRWESTLDSILQDIRLSLRSLLKSPAFALVALISLALGIGANTAIFTLINQVMLRNLPVQHPEQLVTFGPSLNGGINGGIDLGTNDLFPYQFAHPLEKNPGPFQSIASYGSFPFRVTARAPQVNAGGATSEASTSEAGGQFVTSLVSGNFFTTLGANSQLGRTILPSDTLGENEALGRNAIVVVSHHYWEQQLSADPAVIGKSISINNIPYRIVGVMPKAFNGFAQDAHPPDLYVPVTMQQEIMLQPDILTDRGIFYLHVVARRTQASMSASGLKQAQLWLNQQIHGYIRAGEGSAPTAARQQEIERATVPLTLASHGVSQLGSQFGESLKILMVIVVLVLLIACANLANFLLARAAMRKREIATRLALGSSRTRIIRQSLVETMLLSLFGGLLGLAIAFAATRALIAFVVQGATYTNLDPTPDLNVLLFTLGISLFTGLLFGLGPAIHSARTGAAESLSSNTRATTAGRAARLFPKFLVTAQVMLSLLLLIGAGLFLRSLNNLQAQDFGFERTHLLLADFAPKLAGYKASQLPALHQTLIERLQSIPGVRSAALSLTPPIGNGNWAADLTIVGYTPKPKEDMFTILNRVSGHYFETTGISIVQGRAINDRDSATGLKVAVVNQSFAKRYFPKGDAVGSTLKLGIDTVAGPWQIVGIAHDSLINSPHNPTVERLTYLPLAQITNADVKPPTGAPANASSATPAENDDAFAAVIELRTIGDPAQVTVDMRRVISQINSNIPILAVHTIQEQVDTMMTRDQLITSLTSIFSLLALLLAAIGLYGVMNYSVVRRTSEIGIRLALGAQTQSVLWMVLRESLQLLAIGLVLGLPLTFAATKMASSFLQGALFGIRALDPATFAFAVAVVATMTILAAWLPARRATKVDPMVALRCD